MTRKEFILNSVPNIRRITQIILFLLVVSYLIYFLQNSLFEENSNEKEISELSLIIFGMLTLIWLIKYFLHAIWNIFSEKLKSFINQLFKVLEFISIPLLLYIMYINWTENKFIILLIGIFILFSYSNKFLKQTKQT
jgi:hypothetical protein